MTPCAASITAFNPEPHTLLMVREPTLSESPPFNAAWRAGAWPMPALTTHPMMHSSTDAGVDRGASHRLTNRDRTEVGRGK